MDSLYYQLLALAMNSRTIFKMISLLILILAGCSTDPAIEWDKMDEYVLVTGMLQTYPCSQDKVFCWGIHVQRMRPLVGYVFDPDDDQTFFISGAQVTVSDSDSTYVFGEEEPVKNYVWRGDESFVRHGRWYRLEVVLPDGNLVTSEIYSPKIYLDEGADTVWIQPDSITTWSSEPWSHMPIATEGPHYKHMIKYRLTPESYAQNYVLHWELYWINGYPFISEYLFRRIELTDSTIAIYTAVKSPAWFRDQFETITIQDHFGIVRHNLARELHEMSLDDNWPVEHLEEVSNVDGAYGIFTADNYGLAPTFVLALKP
jgi:hypothetical protein